MFRQIGSVLLTKRKSLGELLRYFPYIDLSVQYIPLYAYLYARGLATSPWSLSLLLPFILGHAAGFAYNNLMDAEDPAFRRNPLRSGEISPQQARWLVSGLLLASLLTFGALFDTWPAWLAYAAYIFLGLAYSGLGLRLKESVVGPFIASFTVYTAGVLAIALENVPSWDSTIGGLITAIFLIYVGREIFHTYIDRENDLEAGYRTFAVRFNLPTQLIALALASLSGAICLLWSLYSFSSGWPVNALGLVLVICTLGAAGLQTLYSLRFEPFHPATAFRLYRLCFALYGAYLLGLNPLAAALFIWVFLINRRS
ncbi:UbiA prenyltransferase family protein [Chloroflexota bacterium]